jgi:uncharacterized membrane protein YeaQ/YmgE (transglycosylase-associated protein family)
MDDASFGWIAGIILGGIAGWLAEKITRSNMGVIANVVLGMIGAGLASFVLNKLGIQLGGPIWLAYLIAAFMGALVLIVATRLIAPSRWR